MTKLKLNLAQGAGEILTREELKKVLGGTGSGSGSGGWDGDYTSIRDANGNKVTKKLCEGSKPGDSCEYYRYNTSGQLIHWYGVCKNTGWAYSFICDAR